MTPAPEPGPAPRVLVDPTTARPILMAPFRRHRPMYTAAGAPERPCPFCPGHEGLTPPELLAVRAQGGTANTPGWSVRVFPNKYPAASHHEVIAEGARHCEQPADLDVSVWRDVLAVWQQRIAALEAMPGVHHAFLFKNVGALAGASIAHNHSQIIGLGDLPPRLQLELQQARASAACPICATLAGAAAEGRLIHRDRHHAVLCPDPPKLPHETWLVPLACADDFFTTDLDSLSSALHALFAAVRRGLDDPPFNLWLHRVGGERFHWHFELQPRTGHLAGLELGGDLYINSVEAVVAAARLRSALAR